MSIKSIKYLVILIGIFIYVPCVFASPDNDQKVINDLNKKIDLIVKENTTLNSDINSIKSNQQDYKKQLDLTISNQSNISLANEKLLEAVNTKNDGIDFKEKYWDILFILINVYGVLLLIIATGLGIYKSGEIKGAREDFDKFIDRGNADIEKVIKRQEEDFKEIKDKFIAEIDEVKNQYAMKLADKIDSLKIDASQIAAREIIDGISKKLLEYISSQPGSNEAGINEVKEIMKGLALSEPIEDSFNFKGQDPRKG